MTLALVVIGALAAYCLLVCALGRLTAFNTHSERAHLRAEAQEALARQWVRPRPTPIDVERQR